MTKVAILPEISPQGEISFHAFAGKKHSIGKTAGQALDTLTAQFPSEETGTLVIVQNFRPDKFFSKIQQERLTQLMENWRVARDSGTALAPTEQMELTKLVDDELQAATDRAAAMFKELES